MATGMKKKETFSFVEPHAASVKLAGDFSEWDKHPIELKKERDGVWKATVTLEPGTYHYRFLVDGQWRDDPNCPTRVPNPFGAQDCVRRVA
jgi:1,4-alpha-glucan branching enzyme